MSINVTIGNPVHVRRARMILSDLDQIKKNERDRRRRLRLEQVRQQSKEISNRLLERAKKIAREELNKLERDGRSELKQIHDRKILEVQQKYQEDLDDIGQAHMSAALQPDANEIIEEERKMDRAMALKRGKDAVERMKEANQKDTAEADQQKRLREVREIENMRAAMIAKLSASPGKRNKPETNPFRDVVNEESKETLTPNRKNKILKKSLRKAKKSKEPKKTFESPKAGPSGLKKQVLKPSPQRETQKADRTERLVDDAIDDQLPRGTVPTISTTPTKADKIARYNPEDYTQDISDSTSSISSSSSNSLSDDSSYFSDPAEQSIRDKSVRAPLADGKVQLYDCNLRQRNAYCRPLGIVQRIDIGDEPNAVEAAQAVKDAETAKRHVCKTRILNTKRRGEDAILREKVRRDYQALMRNLDYLTQEERKLKASQIPSNAEEDTHMLLYQRNKCHEERQKRLNRAAKKVLDTYCAPEAEYPRLTEGAIASPTRRKKCVTSCDVPHSTWQEEPPFVGEQAEVCQTDCRRDKDSEISREEQILDMLKKVERQKRLLLQEFGASLPDDIFNASIKSLFEDRPTQTKVSQAAGVARPLSPEIQVINMSANEESVKKRRKAKKADKPSTKKIEIAVQTELDKADRAENKSVQVELPQKLPQESPKQLPKESTDASHSTHSNDTPVRAPHPIEPKVTIITPETDDSSSNDSTSSENGMIIEIDKKEVIVTPKKRRIGVTASKRPSPRIYQKIRSKSVSSKATSPIKRFSRSYSGSRLPSPHKKTKCADTVDVAGRRVDVHVSKSSFNDETDLSQETRVSIDASAESSQTISGTNGQDRTIEPQPYRIRTQTKKWIRIKDTSDTTTSTSYASPPPIQPRSVFEALSNVTPILEMLDTPGAEELRRLRHEISPVSTPETPSPRTMMMPSNIPHRHRISRMLRYSTESQTDGNNLLSSTRIDQATLTESSDIRQESTAPPSECPPTLQRPPAKVCVCKNPTCKLLHTKFDDIHEYALKTCPEILQKYEDLQNLCTERIASLTDLIEKVRNEQRGMDLSLIIPSNETSLMQLPTSIPAHTDEQAVRRLIESIETVHAQLAKTLVESQKFIGSKSHSEDKSVQDEGTQATIASTPRSKLIDSVIADVQKCEVAEGAAKPKIVSDEKVNVKLNRFKMQQKPEATSAAKVAERNSWPPCTSLREEEVIEILLKELLEQRKSLGITSTRNIHTHTTLKEDSETSIQHRESSSKDINLENRISLDREKDNGISKEITSPQEATKETSFVPILTGIPKISRNHGTVSISARPKPPVTLLNGPYRPELESSGHELSTIVEFDTTDAINKSIKSPAKSKPSVHVAPLPVQQTNNFLELTDETSDTKHSAGTFAQRSQETAAICSPPEKIKSTTDDIVTTKTETEQERTLDKFNKQLQCNTTAEESSSQAKDKLNSPVNTDHDNLHKDSKHKTTSTSLVSFSGLSSVSEITSSPSSDPKNASSPEEMEAALKKLGLGWAVTTLKKTREASALSSSSNSDITPVNTARRMISPTKKHHDPSGLLDISDVSSISIKEASKSTEQVVLLKGRTSTPKIQNSNSNSGRSNTTNSPGSIQDASDSLTVPNVSLTKTKSDNKQLQSL